MFTVIVGVSFFLGGLELLMWGMGKPHFIVNLQEVSGNGVLAVIAVHLILTNLDNYICNHILIT